jgi:hypothetical protein
MSPLLLFVREDLGRDNISGLETIKMLAGHRFLKWVKNIGWKNAQIH